MYNSSLFFCDSSVDSSRKSVTHPVDPPSPHRPAAQGEEADDSSMLQSGPRKSLETIIPVQDRIKTAPPQSPSQQEASVSQGTLIFLFKGLLSLTFCSGLILKSLSTVRSPAGPVIMFV